MCLAVPGEILRIEGSDPISRTGEVSFGGTVREVNLACVPEAAVGDFVLVHVGLAIGLVDREEAEELLELLSRLGPESEGEAV